MRAVHENIEGPCVIEDLAVYDLITIGVTLRAGVRLVLHATIARDLTVESDARASIHGTGTVAGQICGVGEGGYFRASSRSQGYLSAGDNHHWPVRLLPPHPISKEQMTNEKKHGCMWQQFICLPARFDLEAATLAAPCRLHPFGRWNLQ